MLKIVDDSILKAKLIECDSTIVAPLLIENRNPNNGKNDSSKKDRVFPDDVAVNEPIPYSVKLKTYIFFLCLAIIGLIHDVLGLCRHTDPRKGYVPLYSWMDNFFRNRVVHRLWFTCHTPILSQPGPEVNTADRETHNSGLTYHMTSGRRKCVNLGSYNYLNMSEVNSPCIPGTLEDLKKYGVAVCATRNEFSTAVHEKLDAAVAEFIGVEAACTFAMGFATNSQNIPSLIDSNCLVISDELNHCSIIVGLRLSRAKLSIFKHNDMNDLERKIRAGIVTGNKGKPWDKIFIMVEGVYSMHGDLCKLPEIVDIKNKYGAYLYVDEAHCMGAVGKTGRGVTEYFNVDPKQVDILMGTFAKAFGAMGGYIAGSRELIDYLKTCSHAHTYGTSMSVTVASFILGGIQFLSSSPEAPLRIQGLRRNACYFRRSIKQMGYIALGEDESPVVPIIVPTGIVAYLTLYMREKNVAIVFVTYPATPLAEGRVRCCLNAMHTKEMLDYALDCFREAKELFYLDLSILPRTTEPIQY